MSGKIEVIHIGEGEKGVELSMPVGLSIHSDDTIMDIKRKIALTRKNITVDELYLFGKIKKKEYPENIFTRFTAKNLRSTSSIPSTCITLSLTSLGKLSATGQFGVVNVIFIFAKLSFST